RDRQKGEEGQEPIEREPRHDGASEQRGCRRDAGLARFMNRCSTSSSGLGAWFLVRPKSLVLRPSQVLGPPPPGAHQGLRGPRTGHERRPKHEGQLPTPNSKLL